MKKLLSVLLALIVLMVPLGQAFAQGSGTVAPTYTIYIRGVTNIYKFSEDGSQSKIYDDADYIKTILLKALPLLAVARITGDYTAYSEKVLEIMRSAYDDFRPSLIDGSVPENTRVDWYWDRSTVEKRVHESNYIEYWVDERLSPFAQAADLNDFIETVKEFSGVKKVLLYARCLGPVALMTYVHEYQRPKNYEDVSALVLSYTTSNGMSLTDAIYTGSVKIPADGMKVWLAPYVSGELEGQVPSGLISVVSALLKGIASSIGMRLTVKELNDLYGKLKDCLFAPFLREYYGLCLENLACVNEKFDDMISYLFPTDALKETYSYAIGEVTRYHETIHPDVPEMLSEIKALGKPLRIFADYGGQEYPVCDDAMNLGDFQVGTRAMSFGATVSRIGETLSDEYIAEREALGLGEWISPDKKVDASTCLFPEDTYFIDNFNHQWPGKYAGLELDSAKLVSEDGATAYTPPSHFLHWDAEKLELIPLSEALESETPQTFQEKLSAFFEQITRFFDDLKSGTLGFLK